MNIWRSFKRSRAAPAEIKWIANYLGTKRTKEIPNFMKKYLLALVALGSLTSNVVRAAEVCDTVDSCRALVATSEARLAVLLKNVMPDLTDIVRDAAGGIRRMKQYDADNYCRYKGQRLPTARELALYAQSVGGAQGISETEKDGYRLVQGSDSAGNPDNFYYSLKGYQRTPGDLRDLEFWSSSLDRYFTHNVYILDNEFGSILSEDTDFTSDTRTLPATRCVRSH